MKKLYLKIAKRKYEDSLKSIDELTEVINKYLPDFSNEELKRSFSYSLESVLLKEALSDNHISEEELDLLKILLSKYNLLDEFKKEFKNTLLSEVIDEINVDDLSTYGVKVNKVILELLETYGNIFIEETAIILGALDAITFKNYYKKFSKNVYALIYLLALMDGKKEKKEIESACNDFVNKFLSTYYETKEYTKELIKEGKEIKKYITKDIKKLRKELFKYLRTHNDEEIKEDLNSLVNEVLNELGVEFKEEE